MELSIGQYDLAYNLFSLTTAAMLAAGIFFVSVRNQVGAKYRTALVVSSLVVFIAGYHYWRITASWEGAFSLVDGSYKENGTKPFNDTYRYADWLVTVPLLLVELVAVLNLARAKASSLMTRLVVASVLMLGLGYPGDISDDSGTRWIFWGLSMVPFLYILKTLVGELDKAVADQSGEVKARLGTARTILLVSWFFYPVAYLLPMVGLDGGTGVVALNVGYAISDITAKALYGFVIYRIALAKTEADGGLAPAGTLAAAQ